MAVGDPRSYFQNRIESGQRFDLEGPEDDSVVLFGLVIQSTSTCLVRKPTEGQYAPFPARVKLDPGFPFDLFLNYGPRQPDGPND